MSSPRIPPNLDLTGKTILITGATSGLGLETARQLLALKVSTLILTARDAIKGEALKQSLLAETDVLKHNPHAKILVLNLDLEDYDSVQAFAVQLKHSVSSLDIVYLNAGAIIGTYTTSRYSHEKTVQVNFLSNVLLLLLLLPLLESSAIARGSPSRVTWIGSRTSYRTSFPQQAFNPGQDSALKIFDSPNKYDFQTQYGDSKFLCAAFFYALAPMISPEKVVLNMLCPGAVRTSLARDLSLFWRIGAVFFKAFVAQPVEKGARSYIYAGAVVGKESHGRFLGDMQIEPIQPLLQSENGRKFQECLWRETIEELRAIVKIPEEW